MAYSATQSTVMVSIDWLGCAPLRFCDCRARFIGMFGQAGNPPLETGAPAGCPSIVKVMLLGVHWTPYVCHWVALELTETCTWCELSPLGPGWTVAA